MHNQKWPNDPFLQLCEIIDYDLALIEIALGEITKDVQGVHRVDIGKLGRLEIRLKKQRKAIINFRDTLFHYAWNNDLESEFRARLSNKYYKKIMILNKHVTDIQAKINSKKGFLDARLSRIEDIANPIKRILIIIAGFVGAVLGITKLPSSNDN